MKLKSYFLIIAGLIGWQCIIGQSTSANNTPAAGKFLGYNGAQDLEFRTNNLTRMTLMQTTGRLGLGIAAPNSIFHISTTATGDVFRSDGPAANANRWQLLTGGTERFRIRTLANGFDTYLERTQVGSEADIRLLTAQIEVRARLKRLGDFCELNGEALSDIVQFGDGTNVNIFNHNANNRGTSFWGTSGTMRSGSFYSIHAPNNVQVDAIAADNNGTTLHEGDIYFQGRLASDTLTHIRIQNGSILPGISVPSILGYNHSNNRHGLAISGRINPSQDDTIPTNAVVEIDGRMGALNGANSVVVNRLLYRLCNFTVPVMTVEAGGQTGISSDSPQNRLHITSLLNDPYFGSVNGSSGLRFTNLTSTATPLANPGTGVLTVDANGDVIYTNSGLQDCRWVDFTDGIGTGFNATNCNQRNVGIGKAPDQKVKLDVRATGAVIQQAIRGVHPFTGGIGGEFQGVAYGVVCDATGAGSPGILCYGDGVSSGGTWVPSDENLKQNIIELTQASNILTQLQPKTYEFRTEEFGYLELASGNQFGFLAQELEEIIPNAVKAFDIPIKLEDGTLSQEVQSVKMVNQMQLIPLLVKGFQEQQNQIKELQEQLASCCSASYDTRRLQFEGTPIEQDVELRSIESIILNQNIPNPFAEQTVINYRIDEDFSRAQILFYDGNGKLIQTSDIKTKGVGQINVFADDLTSGIYSYVLVVDGKIIDTKKMVKK